MWHVYETKIGKQRWWVEVRIESNLKVKIIPICKASDFTLQIDC